MSVATTQMLDERVVFGRDIEPRVNACLQQAVAEAHDFDRARSLLYQALDIKPDQLEVYIALYKYCFYHKQFEEAEKIALNALGMAAERGGFNNDWTSLDENSTDWTQQEGPARVYLYSLKALAFIRMRMENYDSSRQILDCLQLLDPNDQVGGSVIAELMEALEQ